MGQQKSFRNLPEQHGRSRRLVEGHGSLGKVTKPCGAWWRIKEALRKSYVPSFNAFNFVLSKVFLLISSLFWCHMYDVLVYKMLWDRKKILNISLWRIIKLSMRTAAGLCPHISLEKILVYTVLV
jgi:hypothetical protein